MDNKLKKLIEILQTMNEVYSPEIERSKVFYESYYQALKDIPIEDIANNASKHLKTSKFFPKPADLRNDDSVDDKALLAWEKTYKAIKKYGYWNSVKFDDLAIHSTIELMGGWCKLSEMLADEEKWKRKEFIETYKIMQKRKEHPEYLIGQHEINNSEGDFKIQPPVLIGDRGKKLICQKKEKINYESKMSRS